MREDIKLKKYRMIHKRINEHYCNDFLNVKQSCQREGITPSTYYKICKTLNKRSVGTDKNGTQNGGSKTNKKVNNDKMTIKKNEMTIKKKTLDTNDGDFGTHLHEKRHSKQMH